MQYRVEQLAAVSGVTVDTVRFYQGRGLIPAPRREGRTAIYEDQHRDAIERVRDLKAQGFTLSQIERLKPDSKMARKQEVASGLLGALLEERVGSRTWTREAFAAESGLGMPLLGVAERAGLLVPIRVNGEACFTDVDMKMAHAGRVVLEAGFPLDRLMGLADFHDQSVKGVASQAIELFDEFVRQPHENEEEELEPHRVVEQVYRELLPAVTRLVALHFQHTIVQSALERLRNMGEDSDLEAALVATESARLEVHWR